MKIRPIIFYCRQFWNDDSKKQTNHRGDSVLYLGLSYLVDLTITPMIGK